MNGNLILVLGGTRSGKSALAERLAAMAGMPVTYLATARPRPDDADHVARIAAHRARRPQGWETIECADADALATTITATDPDRALLVDSLSTWVAGHGNLSSLDPTPLCAALRARTSPTVVVSEEVGMSIHAPTEIGRHFVDALGHVNHAVSLLADRAILVVAGRALDLPAPMPGSSTDADPRADPAPRTGGDPGGSPR